MHNMNKDSSHVQQIQVTSDEHRDVMRSGYYIMGLHTGKPVGVGTE
jgi:hypothetical protein